MHVRPVREVAAVREVGVAERLDVRDARRSEPGLLRRGEAEEELGPVRNEIGAVDPRRPRHLLRQARPAVEAAPDEPLADARHLEQPTEFVEHRLRTGPDVRERVAAEEDRHVVRLELRRGRVGREPDGVLEDANLVPTGRGGAAIHGDVRRGLAGDVAVEVRETPGDGDTQSCGRLLEPCIEVGERVLEGRACVGERGNTLLHAEPRGDDLMMERRHEHLDVVVRHDADAVEEVLLGWARPGRDASRRARHPVGELVDARCRERGARGASDELLPGQAHVRTVMQSGAGSARACSSSD